MTTVNDWLFCQLVDCEGLMFPREPYYLGNSEISGQQEPFPEAESALLASLGMCGLDTKRGYGRVRIVITDATWRQAQREGRLHIRESVALLRYAIPLMQRIRVHDAGYLLNLQTLRAMPLMPPSLQSLPTTMMVMHLIDDRAQYAAFVVNKALRLGDASGELAQALRRSAHWSEVASRIDDIGEQFLVKWMSVECLCRTGVEEVINAKILAAAHLPTGNYFMQIPADDRAILRVETRFKTWTRRASALVERLRVARNSIAHSGYRELDLRDSMTESDLCTSMVLMDWAVRGAQDLAIKGLALGVLTVADLWRSYGRCVTAVQGASFKSEVLGTVIVALENASTLAEL